MPEGILIEEVKLANGLSLFVYDQSRPLVGDRWLAKLLLYIPMKIKLEHFGHVPDTNQAYAAFVGVMGHEIAMQQIRLRNFLDQKDVPEALLQIKEEILATTLPYVSNSDFEARFVKRRYAEWCESGEWNKSD